MLYQVAKERTLAVSRTLKRSVFPSSVQAYRILQALVHCVKDRRKKSVS